MASSAICKEVRDLSDEQVKTWFNSFDTVMTDCDGVLWIGNYSPLLKPPLTSTHLVGSEPISGSPDLIQRFRQLGKRVFYVTNNSTKHRREYKKKEGVKKKI